MNELVCQREGGRKEGGGDGQGYGGTDHVGSPGHREEFYLKGNGSHEFYSKSNGRHERALSREGAQSDL